MSTATLAPPVWQQDRVDAGGVELARFATGSTDADAPTLIVIHGLGHWTSAAWDRLVPLLDPAWRIIAFDLPGFGESAKPDVAYDLPFFSRTIRAAIDSSTAGRFALCGHSIGGMIAAEIAPSFGDRLSHLALMAPAGFARTPRLIVRMLASPILRLLFMRKPNRGFVVQTLRSSVHTPDAVTDDVAARAFELSQDLAVRRAFAGVYSGAIQSMLDLRTLHRGFARYTGPAFIAWGRHDRFIPVKALDEARKVYPQASTIVLEHSGHVIMIEETALLSEALRAFLAS